MSNNQSPVVALTLGDPAGVGAELIARLLSRPEAGSVANIVLVGDEWLWQEGQRIAGVRVETVAVSSLADVRSRSNSGCPAFLALDSIDRGQVRVGTSQAAGGQSVLRVLNHCMDGALCGDVDSICFAPLNKKAMKMGGLKHEDELHHFAEYLKVDGYFCEFNTLGKIWTSRLSSHVPMASIHSYITEERLHQAALLIYNSLLATGISEPQVAIAALNPHGGEGGTCGREEIDVIEPAVEKLRAQHWPTPDPFHGPFPADTIFLKAQAGEYHGVVTMYHDQGQIAIKLLGFRHGVTVQGGLPLPICTPAHGTAYDIVGQGKASDEATWHAFQIAARMGRARHRPTSKL